MLAPTRPVLLVDGDVVAYRCAASAEKTYYAVTEGNSKEAAYYDNHKEAKVHADGIEGWIWSRKEVQPEEFALQSCKTVLNSLREKFPDSQDLVIYLSGIRNFRDFIWKTKKYKGNRDAVSRPTHLAACRDYLSRVWGARITDGYEADDALGIELSAVGNAGVIVSNDKDLDQLAGWHFNWVTGETYRITRRAADCFLHEQILSGDATDNVPGVEGMGPAKASRCLEGATSRADLVARVQGVYRDRYGDSAEAYLQEQTDLVYIWRQPNDRYLITGTNAA